MGREAKGEGKERLERSKNRGLGILDSGSRWRGGEYRLDESISRVRSRHPVLMHVLSTRSWGSAMTRGMISPAAPSRIGIIRN